jgi:phage anti-repressor protein
LFVLNARLEVQKHKLKETLQKSYIKDVDYKISRVYKPKGTGGQKKEIIMISIDCFKMICQSTKSKKGKEVRRYFIDVEKLLNKYKSYIIEGLEDKVKSLQKDRKPKINPQKGVIYVFRTPDTPENNLYKIGKTIDLKKRLQSHSSGLSSIRYRLPENIFIDKNILLINFIYYKFKQCFCK